MKGEGIASVICIVLVVALLASFIGNFASIKDDLVGDLWGDESSNTPSTDGIVNGSTGNGSTNGENTGTGGSSEGESNTGGDSNETVDPALSEALEKLSFLISYLYFNDRNDPRCDDGDAVRWIFCAEQPYFRELEAAGYNVSFGYVIYHLEKNGEAVYTTPPTVSYTKENGFALSGESGKLVLVHNTDGTHSPNDRYLTYDDLACVNDSTFAAKLSGLNSIDGTSKTACLAFAVLNYEHVVYTYGPSVDIRNSQEKR